VQSTFYLGEEEEEPEMESRMEDEGQSAEELFGDDWSSTDEEEQEMAAAAAEEQRGRAEAVTAVTADEGKQPPKQGNPCKYCNYIVVALILYCFNGNSCLFPTNVFNLQFLSKIPKDTNNRT
jgi:hypothetical protein